MNEVRVFYHLVKTNLYQAELLHGFLLLIENVGSRRIGVHPKSVDSEIQHDLKVPEEEGSGVVLLLTTVVVQME